MLARFLSFFRAGKKLSSFQSRNNKGAPFGDCLGSVLPPTVRTERKDGQSRRRRATQENLRLQAEAVSATAAQINPTLASAAFVALRGGVSRAMPRLPTPTLQLRAPNTTGPL